MDDRFGSLVLLLGDDVSLRWLLTLMHFLWQGAVVGVVVAIAGRFLRGASARSRYVLYSAALLSLPVCVAVTFCVVDVPTNLQSHSQPESPADIPARLPAPPSQAAAITAAVQMETAEATDAFASGERAVENTSQMKAVADDNSLSHSSLAMLSRAAPWITVAYVVGVVCFLLRLLTAVWGGHRLRIRTARVTDAKLLKLIADQADRVKLKCVPVVAYCERVAVPTVLGMLRPMILLPASLMTGLTPDDFAAIIRHELVHIRRYDLWMNLLQRVIESLLFFHPVVWLISRKLNAEREICCDDLVVSSGYEPMHYAGALLRMAELCAVSRQPGALGLAASGNKPPLLERRIERLMNWGNMPRLQLTRTGMAGLLMVLVSLIVVPGIAHTWAQAQTPGESSEPTAEAQPIRAEKSAVEAKSVATDINLKHENAQKLFRKWQDSARINGKIPGGALGSLAGAMANFVKFNPTDERAPKLAELLKRIDMSRDWTQADAAALLDDVTAVYPNMPKWAVDLPRFSIAESIRTGQPLPAELENAPWGQAQPNGLRAAWLLDPRAEQHRLGTPLKSRILFHNAGKNSVVFRVLTWNQSNDHKAHDAKGAEIKISSTYWTTIPQVVACRFAPGEYTEVTGAGIGIGAMKDEEDWRGTRVGSWIEAKEGDEVIFTPAPVSVSGRDDLPRPLPRPPWWLEFITNRLKRDAPLPDAAAERKRLLDRAIRDLFGTPPTPKETAAFVADRASNAMQALANRLAQRAGTTPFTGTLQSAETKFRVLAADPNAAKKPRVATGPGRYTLADHVRLVIVQKPVGKRRVNGAKIMFFSPNPNTEPPGKPHEIKLPDGLHTWAIAWERGSTVLWVAEKGVLRSYDFSTSAQVKETRIEPATLTNVPEPLRKALRPVLEGSKDGTLSEQSAGTLDHLLGWYKLDDRTLIPVFKIDRTYYSVIHPGTEIPLKECPEGLQWDLAPSSMAGTKIGSDGKSNEVYISIVDSIREKQEQSFVSGRKRPMTRDGKPSWLLDATAPPPRAHDDFLGWYQPVWCPYARLEIKKEGKRYLARFEILRELDETDSWTPDGEPHELSLLPNGFGFIMKQEDVTHHIVYNKSLKRYEMTSSNKPSRIFRIPLARIAAPSPHKKSARSPRMRIGIPSWN